jgi:hypothetical protein
LSSDEQARLIAWIDQGAVEGAPQPPTPVAMASGLPRVDRRLAMREPYLPNPGEGKTDDTRCFLLDWDDAETQYVTGLDLRPGIPSAVHHALIMIARQGDLAALEKLDGDDPGPGWACPGSLVRVSGYLGGWTPGFAAQVLPPGLGHELRPGDKLILSVHYSPHDPSEVRPDVSEVQLMLQAEPTRPMKAIAVYDLRWPFGQMGIPAGQADVSHRYSFDPAPFYSNGKPMLLYGVTLHMHERGAKGSVVILRRDGSTECLVQVDRYDHTWQGDYRFGEPKRLEPGDHLSIECTWGNSGNSQDLKWSEDSEMCLSFVSASVLE